MYNVNDEVMTPKGKGKVSYAEEGYVEVDVNGVEMGFEAPYANLEAYVPGKHDTATQTKGRSDSDTAQEAYSIPPAPEWNEEFQMLEGE